MYTLYLDFVLLSRSNFLFPSNHLYMCKVLLCLFLVHNSRSIVHVKSGF